MRKSLTYDRGSEIARHRELTQQIEVAVYFADPSSLAAGGNENANGLIREDLPKSTGLSIFTQGELNAIANTLNDPPRPYPQLPNTA